MAPYSEGMLGDGVLRFFFVIGNSTKFKRNWFLEGDISWIMSSHVGQWHRPHKLLPSLVL
jgi:hypothetical protein